MDLLRESLRSLRAHALRFALTSLGIVWGMAMLTYLVASMDGYEQHFAAQVAKIGARIVFLFPGIVTKTQVGNRGARSVKLELKDVDRLPALLEVERAAPNVWVGPRVFRAARRTKLLYTYGVTEDTAVIRGFEVGAGRMISSEDVREAASVVFLGAKAAGRLLGRAPPLGRTVHIDGTPFRVIGVSKAKGEQLLYVGPADDEIALVPVTAAERWLTRSDTVNQVVFAPRTRAESWDALRQARGLLGLHHHFAADDESAMGAFNVQDIVRIIDTLLLGLRIFLSTASLITLFVGAVGVMNIMLVMVSERTREIGLRKAVGASNREVFLQFLTETLAVTVVAGLVGTAIGWLAVRGVAAAVGAGSILQGPPVLRPGAVATIFATLVGVGIVAGLLPARRATRTDPAIALRSL